MLFGPCGTTHIVSPILPENGTVQLCPPLAFTVTYWGTGRLSQSCSANCRTLVHHTWRLLSDELRQVSTIQYWGYSGRNHPPCAHLSQTLRLLGMLPERIWFCFLVLIFCFEKSNSVQAQSLFPTQAKVHKGWYPCSPSMDACERQRYTKYHFFSLKGILLAR